MKIDERIFSDLMGLDPENSERWLAHKSDVQSLLDIIRNQGRQIEYGESFIMNQARIISDLKRRARYLWPLIGNNKKQNLASVDHINDPLDGIDFNYHEYNPRP